MSMQNEIYHRSLRQPVMAPNVRSCTSMPTNFILSVLPSHTPKSNLLHEHFSVCTSVTDHNTLHRTFNSSIRKLNEMHQEFVNLCYSSLLWSLKLTTRTHNTVYDDF